MKHIKEIIKKFLDYVGWILAGVLILFILVDYKAHSDLAEIYASLDQGTASASDMKKLEFLSSYIKATEDISIMGKINGTWTDTQPGDAPIVEDPGDGSGGDGSGDQIGTTNSYTPEGWREALAKNNCPYYQEGKGFIFETVNGVTYLTEKQSQGYWKNLGDSTGGSTVDGKGCWLFAMTNAANNLNGTTYSVKDVLEKRNGNDKISWDSATNMWISTIKNRGIGMNYYNSDNVAFDYMGCTSKMISSNVGSVEDLYTILSNEGFDDCVYIAYFHTFKTASQTGGCHWMAIMGIDDSTIFVLNNYGRGVQIPKSGHTKNPVCNATTEVTKLFRICPK